MFYTGMDYGRIVVLYKIFLGFIKKVHEIFSSDFSLSCLIATLFFSSRS